MPSNNLHTHQYESPSTLLNFYYDKESKSFGTYNLFISISMYYERKTTINGVTTSFIPWT
jgi:hypothetical protein